MTRGTQSGAKRAGPASKAKGRFSGGARKKVRAFFAGTLFWEEPEKQRPAVPQNRGHRRIVFVRWGDGTPGNPERVPESEGEHMLLEQPEREESNSRRKKNFTPQEQSWLSG